MMEAKGMTAIVRGLPDSRLMVTLMDGGRQYTLMPQEAEVKQPEPRPQNICYNMSTQHSQCVRSDTVSTRCDIGSQAVDSRYASSYKMDYCHLQPSSPPVEVTEFPPQHTQFRSGRGNFEVGGLGSGSYSPIRSKNTYIISKSPDKGRTISTRDTIKPDVFTESLRRYPSLSPDSSEVVQRLHSYSKEVKASRNNLFKLNECVNCYHASIDNKSPYVPRKNHWKPKNFHEQSPPKNLKSNGHSISSKPKEINIPVVKNKPRQVMQSNITHNSSQAGSDMKDSEVVNAPFITSADNISTFVHTEKEILCNTYKETGDPMESNFFIKNDGSIQNTGSTKTCKSLIELGETTDKKALQKRKKIRSQLQLYKNCKKIKLKPCCVQVKKRGPRNFKTNVNLIKTFNDPDKSIKLEKKIKKLVCKLLQDLTDPEEKLKKELHKYIYKSDSYVSRIAKDYHTKYRCSNIVASEKALDEVHEKFIILWKNHLKRVSDIHRIITKELLRIVKYILKKNEDKEVELPTSKIFKIIVNTLKSNENDILVLQNNYLELMKPPREECQRNKKDILNITARHRAKKYHHYLRSLRKLIESETLHVINNYKKGHRKPKKSFNLTYHNVININRVLNTIESLVPIQTEYVTNMLLNQFCMTKHEDSIDHQKTKNNMVGVDLKCLSDTYILIHSTSQNKSILTQSKIDKTNLKHGTKLLTSIKNKYAFESNIAKAEIKNYICDNIYPNIRDTTQYMRENDKSSFSSTKKPHAISEEENLMYQKIHRKVEKKVFIWFCKYYINFLPINNEKRENISNDITNDVTDQLVLFHKMKPICTIKSAYAEENLKNIICTHLYLIKNNENIELVEQVSELVEDILTIIQADISKNSRTKLPNCLSPVPKSSIGNYTFKPATPVISVSKSFQSIKNVLEDIYARVEFCDDDVRKTLVKNYTEEADNNYTNSDNDINDFNKERIKYSHFTKNYNKSGIINVAMANENSSINSSHSNTSNVIRNNEKTNQTENFPADLADNEAQATGSNSNVSKKSSVESTIQKLHEYCVGVFRKHCERLPISATTPEVEELARAGILHNIMNTFSTLLKDPDIANDYTLFELYMEDDIDELLDLLPQTEEIKRVRETWKINLLIDAIMLLKHIHKITDAPGFEHKLNAKTSRRKLLLENRRENDEAQQLNVLEMVEQYINSTNYDNSNPLVVRIYRQRLADRINELYNCFKKTAKTSFLKLPVHVLKDAILKDLDDVPKPHNNISKEEIDLVNMNDEVANWYKELPVLQMDESAIDNIKRKILIQALAKKIYNMEKNVDLDEPSAERNMRHEISMFLSSTVAGLQYEQDLNINSMVDKLTDRLRKKRQEKQLKYESFAQNLPFSSTIVQHDAPCDSTRRFSDQNSRMVNDNEHFDNYNRSKNLQDSCLVCPIVDKKNIKLKPIARTTAKGILGISQIAGPSTRSNVCSSPVHSRIPTPREAPQTISEFSSSSCSPSRYTHNSGPFYDLVPAGPATPTNNLYIKEEMLSTNNRCVNGQMIPTANKHVYDERTQMNNACPNEQMTPNYTRFMHDQMTPINNRDMSLDLEASTPCQRQKRSGNSFSIFRRKRHSDNMSNFTPYDLRLPYSGQAIGNSPTRQMENYPDRIKTCTIDSGRSRNPSKMRCLCADSRMQPCRHFTYCCQDYFSEDCCCRSPYHDFY